jgi:DnaJ like chaperone protein
MNWTGKVLGGALGLAVGGPFGLALGAVLGHVYDAKQDDREREPALGREDSAGTGADRIASQFFATTFEVMGHVAKADGRVSEEEIRAARGVMSEFRLDESHVRAAIQHFTRGKQADFDLSRSIMRLRAACAGRPDLLRVFLEIQLRAAIAGTDLVGPSRPLMQRIAATLGVGGLEFAHMETVLRLRQGSYAPGGAGSRQYGGRAGDNGNRPGAPRGMQVSEAYQILEIDAQASDDDVIKAYRRQLSRHHPDKLKANGLPESMLEHAKQRTQQIIEAHDCIRAARGMA